MPDDDRNKTTFDNLTLFEHGYADSLLDNEGNSSFAEEWKGIGREDFADDALRVIVEDCRRFLASVTGDGPDAEDELFGEVDEYDLGWHFYLERQGVGVGFADMLLDDLGDRLVEASEAFDWIVVEIGDDRKIHLRRAEPGATANPSK